MGLNISEHNNNFYLQHPVLEELNDTSEATILYLCRSHLTKNSCSINSQANSIWKGVKLRRFALNRLEYISYFIFSFSFCKSEIFLLRRCSTFWEAVLSVLRRRREPVSLGSMWSRWTSRLDIVWNVKNQSHPISLYIVKNIFHQNLYILLN